MDKPAGVQQAVVTIWITIVISALVILVDKWVGDISESTFVGLLFMCSLFCILPYKIGRGSNAARYTYIVLTVVSILFGLGGAGKVPKLDLIVSILLIPVESFIIYRLFQREASQWFVSR